MVKKHKKALVKQKTFLKKCVEKNVQKTQQKKGKKWPKRIL
jgi:hypothetical protein